LQQALKRSKQQAQKKPPKRIIGGFFYYMAGKRLCSDLFLQIKNLPLDAAQWTVQTILAAT
jgi:hypothetical protein